MEVSASSTSSDVQGTFALLEMQDLSLSAPLVMKHRRCSF